ncbi:YIF1-domain-containing protein [Ascobolus immersus RN42]|uniref:Protein YIF1 n=1 Tax=Ascobolus immersus RN42 TaxID=1160509 RepID=A0A3N4IBW5_ASCIM|nr:YIF1-domain-containing protein [Ascobolus immersus RN42]
MQRQPFATSATPPLHHPVPQHVRPIPVVRSPPIPQPSSAQSYNSPYASQQQQPPQMQGGMGGFQGMYPAQYNGFINDQTAQMGIHMGKTAVMAGQEYVEQNFGRYIDVSALKHYFNVSNQYVVRKLGLVLFPWRHKPWSRMSGQRTVAGGHVEPYFLPPRDDINSPDMYIPRKSSEALVMSIVTYILFNAVLAGLAGQFKPDLLGNSATRACLIVAAELLGLKLGCYLLSINNDSTLLDLVAYSGYKFVGVVVNMGVGHLFFGWKMLGWVVFAYTFLANAFFLLRSLKYVLLPDNSVDNPRGTMYAVARAQKNRRTQFLFAYSYAAQLLFMWLLSN